MTIRLIAFSLFLTTASVASAQTADEARVSLALRMFELMDAKGNIERTMSAALKAQAEGMVSAARQAGVPETILEKLGPLQEDVLKLMMTELKMESVFRDMALIYSSLFTEDELREMIAFYESPTGRKLTAKTPEMMSRIVEITMIRMREIEPKLLELIKKRLQQ